MRDGQLTAADPMTLYLAADVRHFRTDYADDQIWELAVGQDQTPALVLQTRYGGRVGLARLVPMWAVDGHVIHEASAYAAPPVLRTFWSSYLNLAARPASHLLLEAEYWAVESHVVAGCFTFTNEGSQPTHVGVDLFAQVMSEMQDHEVRALAGEEGRPALHMRDVSGLQPVILLENAASVGGRPKLSAAATIPPGGRASIRWVHAALPTLRASLVTAEHWLSAEDWQKHRDRLRDINTSTPIIETGDPGVDAAIAFSYRTLLQSFVGPTGSLPYPSFVLARIPGRGFSPRGDGSDHNWEWDGQAAAGSYLILPAIASVEPELAKGVIRNFLAVQGSDGFIDWKPGLGGQRKDLLSLPLLAYTAWLVFLYTEDRDFLAEVYPGLLRFFGRWIQSDMDRDGDGLPEWASVKQSNFDDNPAFLPYRRGAQNADISKAESPDLAAYLIQEGRGLINMARTLGKKGDQTAVQERIDALQGHLAALWNEATGSYQYRERDTHISVAGVEVAEGTADLALIPSLDLDPPNRLIVRVVGGRDHRPAMTITLEGLDAAGNAVVETLPAEAFVWHRGMGAATTAHLYRRIDRITPAGLSRVYEVQVGSVDWTRQDQTLLLPLLAGSDDPARTEALIKTITDPARYWRTYGIPACPADGPGYDPANANGCGGVRLFWNALLGEGLIDSGRPDLAADLLLRILQAQIHTLRTEKAFRQAYHADAPEGLGEVGHALGVVPLHLLWRLMGIRVVSSRKVWVGGKYALPWPVTIRHLGITIRRDADGAAITFPSGYKKRIRSGKWQAVEDTSAVPDKKQPTLATFAAPPVPAALQPPKTVRVKVSVDDEAPDESQP